MASESMNIKILQSDFLTFKYWYSWICSLIL